MLRRLALPLTALAAAFAFAPAAPVTPAVPAAQTTGHLSGVEAAASAAPSTTSGSTYAFSSSYQGSPLRWNPCAPIHWTFRAPGAPAGGLAVATAAVARVAAATGTQWVFDGTTSTNPVTGYLPRRPGLGIPVLIGFTDGQHSDLLAGQPHSTVGMTRTVWFSADDGRGHRGAAIQGAVIALARDHRLPLNGNGSWSAVLQHELGHAVGLAHAGSSRELMYPTLPAGLHGYAAGDLAGLHRVGRTMGCITLPS